MALCRTCGRDWPTDLPVCPDDGTELEEATAVMAGPPTTMPPTPRPLPGVSAGPRGGRPARAAGTPTPALTPTPMAAPPRPREEVRRVATGAAIMPGTMVG